MFSLGGAWLLCAKDILVPIISLHGSVSSYNHTLNKRWMIQGSNKRWDSCLDQFLQIPLPNANKEPTEE